MHDRNYFAGLTAAQIADGEAAAGIIRKWYPTVMYELMLPQERCSLRIGYELVTNTVGAVALGQFSSHDWSITLFAVPGVRRGGLLNTLLHEARHAWQIHHADRIAPTEADCDDFAATFRRRHPNGPTQDPYQGLIYGELLRCPLGHLVRCGVECKACREKREKERAAAHAVAQAAAAVLREQEAANGGAMEEEQRRLRQAEEFEQRRIRNLYGSTRNEQRQHRAQEAWHRMIDSHPDNGRPGRWLIDGVFIVNANSAGEAVIKVAAALATSRPRVKFLG